VKVWIDFLPVEPAIADDFRVGRWQKQTEKIAKKGLAKPLTQV
jgi:hypothetical protein